MLRKLTLGLVAAASLGAMALAPSAASAKPWNGGLGGGYGIGYGGGWGYHHHFHGPHFGIGLVSDNDGSCYVTRRIATPYGYRLRTINVCD
ncbi:hypothetical protein BH11PSE4_BH11PSE4_33680 [soil metagenome]